MTVEDIEAKSRYKKTIVAYLLIFYIISMILTMLLLNVYTSINSLDLSQFSEIISSGNYSSYLETMPVITIHAIKFLSLNNLIVYILCIIVLCYFLQKDFIDDFNIFKKENINKTLKTLLVSTVVFFILYFGVNIIINLISEAMGITTSANQEFIELAIDNSTFSIFLATVFLGPIVEELVFRKAAFGLFKDKRVALLVSTLVFAAIHMISSLGLGYSFLEMLVMTIPYLAGGLLFGLIYMKTKYNMYYVIIIHILINLTSVVTLLFQ